MTNYNLSAAQSTQETYQHPWYTQQLQLENTTNSDAQLQQKQSKGKTGHKFINKYSTNRLGDICEQFVVYEALKRGAEVYTNASCKGKTDLIIGFSEGVIYEFDVKSGNLKQNKNGTWSWRANNAALVSEPRWPIVVELREDYWKVRWPLDRKRNPKCPEGLERFWD